MTTARRVNLLRTIVLDAQLPQGLGRFVYVDGHDAVISAFNPGGPEFSLPVIQQLRNGFSTDAGDLGTMPVLVFRSTLAQALSITDGWTE